VLLDHATVGGNDDKVGLVASVVDHFKELDARGLARCVKHRSFNDCVQSALSSYASLSSSNNFEAIHFSRKNWRDVEAARASLKSTVEEVMTPKFEVENPITHARGVIKVS
jgi:hypothetical protein